MEGIYWRSNLEEERFPLHYENIEKYLYQLVYNLLSEFYGLEITTISNYGSFIGDIGVRVINMENRKSICIVYNLSFPYNLLIDNQRIELKTSLVDGVLSKEQIKVLENKLLVWIFNNAV
jgi:hypothetical protein